MGNEHLEISSILEDNMIELDKLSEVKVNDDNAISGLTSIFNTRNQLRTVMKENKVLLGENADNWEHAFKGYLNVFDYAVGEILLDDTYKIKTMLDHPLSDKDSNVQFIKLRIGMSFKKFKELSWMKEDDKTSSAITYVEEQLSNYFLDEVKITDIPKLEDGIEVLCSTNNFKKIVEELSINYYKYGTDGEVSFEVTRCNIGTNKRNQGNVVLLLKNKKKILSQLQEKEKGGKGLEIIAQTLGDPSRIIYDYSQEDCITKIIFKLYKNRSNEQ